MDSFFSLTLCYVAVGFFTLVGTILFMFYGKFRFRQSNEIVSLSLSLPSSSLPRSCTHQVFPSFCGEDVRKEFFSYIRKEFERKGITPFIDNEIKRGESIGPELEHAIRESKIAIVLLSRNYASSSWCLNELVEIMRCREVLGQVVMTIFYEVDPTDVKKQTGDFGKVFKKTCKGKLKEDIMRWSHALAEVATIAGYHSSNWIYEADMVNKIATDVSNVLNSSIPSTYLDSLVGIGTHMDKMWSLLSLDLNEVIMVGIWGPAGIGKTAIARAVYEKLCGNFTHTAFMESIKVGYTTNSQAYMLHLQEQLLSTTLDQKNLRIQHLDVARGRLKDKKVLVVLDDVDRLMQLTAMANQPGWFGPGSRIIITTQDKNILKAHKIQRIYKVGFPADEEALQIFCMSAFGQKFPEMGFEDLAQEVTKLSGKLPLGLNVMGSYFREMSAQEWENELPRIRIWLHNDIKSILRFNYDALCDEDKKLFLYIAFLFNLKSIQTLEDFLSEMFVDMNQGLNILARKSLISREYGFIKMHNLLVQLGREIVRNQCVRKPGKRQFLVDAREICEVLTNKTGSGSLEGMDLDLSEINDEFNIKERSFKKMCNLQFLRIHGRIDGSKGIRLYYPQCLAYLSQKLRLLHWDYFPMTCLPSSFVTKNLVELNMRESKLEKLWEEVQPLQNLKWMDLSYSKNLKNVPDLSTATNLLFLDLNHCSMLMELPYSIGNATSLMVLNIDYCSSLVKIPSSIGKIPNLKIFLAWCSSMEQLPSCIWNITSLSTFNLGNFSSAANHPLTWNTRDFQELDLSGCSSLKELPSVENANYLKELHFDRYTNQMRFPSFVRNATNPRRLNREQCLSLVKHYSSIRNATNLGRLNHSGCSSMRQLASTVNANNLKELHFDGHANHMEFPSFLGNVKNLRRLNLENCSSLVKLPSSIKYATELNALLLSGCSSLVELPSCIGSAPNLYILDIKNCSSLVKLPSFIRNQTPLVKLKLTGCSSLIELPSSIEYAYRLSMLSLKGCSKLEALPTNINLPRLGKLDLTDCSLLNVFPEISTNIKTLLLSGTAIDMVPYSITSCSCLQELSMSYSEHLVKCSDNLGSITTLYLSDTELQNFAPQFMRFSRLRGLVVVKGGIKLVSPPQLPDSDFDFDEEICESPEIQDCFFHHPYTCLNLPNCFKLNQETRQLIMETTSNLKFSVFPGREVPRFFTNRATGNSLTVIFPRRPLLTYMRFKACILLVNEGGREAVGRRMMNVVCNITSKLHCPTVTYTSINDRIHPILTEHLYIFGVESKEVTSNELFFEFKVDHCDWKIRECGVL